MDKTGAVKAALIKIAADWDADTPDHTTQIEVTSVKLLASDDAVSLPKHPRPIDATAQQIFFQSDQSGV